MRSAKSVGRMIGILLLVQGAAGYVVNFVLLAPVMTVPPGLLANAAGSALQVRVAVLLGLANGALSVGIAIAAWQVFRRYGDTMALWLVSLSVVGFSLLAFEDRPHRQEGSLWRPEISPAMQTVPSTSAEALKGEKS